MDNYRPSNISFITAPTSGVTITSFFTSSNPGEAGLPLNDGGAQITKVSPDRFWTLTAGEGLTGGTYNIDLTADNFQGVEDYTKLYLLKRVNGSSNWVLEGTHSVCTGSNTSPTVHRTGLVTFSEFGVGSTNDNPLPVNLSAFSATVNKDYVILKWRTENKINNFGFDIERKSASDKDKWQKIGFTEGKRNISTSTDYNFTDKSLKSGKYH